ncbi:MAG: HAD family hydrolase [Lentisphaerota bacterium]
MNEITAVLFDIDGTLLDMKGAGRRAFILALEKVFGWKDDLAYINFAGNTDLNVLRQIMESRKTTLADSDIARFFEQIPIELEREAKNAELILYPGVRLLLETLAADERAMLGLVTGNIEACAKIKLRQFDLHDHFVLGGFGDRFPDRADIACHALQLVKDRLDSGQSLQQVFLIGDTPYDVAAARHIGAVAIAVSTGKFSARELQECGADHVLETLKDTGQVLNLLGVGA